MTDRKPTMRRGRWTRATCQTEAKKYQTRTAWREGSPESYEAARQNAWLSKCTAHMASIKVGASKAGASWDLAACLFEARQYSSVEDWQRSSPESYREADLSGWLAVCTSHLAVEDNHWTREACLAEARGFKTVTAWLLKSPLSYNAAKSNGWFEECCSHFPEAPWVAGRDPVVGQKTKAPRGFWTLKHCLIVARRYVRPSDWAKWSPSSFNAARRNGWTAACVAHMPLPAPWTREACLAEARKHSNRTAWFRANSCSYRAAEENGWYDECVSHMKSPRKMKEFWTRDECIAAALEFVTRTEWCKGSPTSYRTARENNWFSDCVSHMPVGTRGWKLEACLIVARRYQSPEEWEEASPISYRAAKNKRWLPECTAHMRSPEPAAEPSPAPEKPVHNPRRRKAAKGFDDLRDAIGSSDD